MAEQGWYVHRVWNDDVYNNLEAVLESIGQLLRDSEIGGL